MGNENLDFTVQRLGQCLNPSPMVGVSFIPDSAQVPVPLAVSLRKRIDPEGWLWAAVMSSTGQARNM